MQVLTRTAHGMCQGEDHVRDNAICSCFPFLGGGWDIGLVGDCT